LGLKARVVSPFKLFKLRSNEYVSHTFISFVF